MDLSIIIVSWNTEKLLRENIQNIYENTRNINFEIFIIDNNSKDNTVKMIKNNFPQVKLIENNYNVGFARANNQAIKKSSGQFILLLNPDMRVLPKTLEKMVRWMEKNKKAGVAGCHLIDKNNKTIKHIRKFPTLFDQLMIVLKVPHIFPSVLNGYLLKNFDYQKEAIVDSIRGSFFMIRREIIDVVGLLDEQYFIWFEEVDYCQRVKKTKWQVMYTPEIKCIDYIGQSFSQIQGRKKQKYFQESMLKYFKKWHPIWQYWVLQIVWFIGFCLFWLWRVIKIKSKIKT